MKQMIKRFPLYKPLAAVSLVYIIYVLFNNLVIDPGAETFLSYKTDVAREPNPRVWLPVLYIHIGFACLAMASGLVNFSAFSHGRRVLHRVNGYVYVISVLIVVLSSGYMAPYATGGKISSIGFNLLNLIWLAVTATALIHIYRNRVPLHRRWMIRSYAFCFTNMFIHLFTLILYQWLGFAYATSYITGVYGSIALLLILPEAAFRLGKHWRRNRKA